jgi:hypothetical protein
MGPPQHRSSRKWDFETGAEKHIVRYNFVGLSRPTDLKKQGGSHDHFENNNTRSGHRRHSL